MIEYLLTLFYVVQIGCNPDPSLFFTQLLSYLFYHTSLFINRYTHPIPFTPTPPTAYPQLFLESFKAQVIATPLRSSRSSPFFWFVQMLILLSRRLPQRYCFRFVIQFSPPGETAQSFELPSSFSCWEKTKNAGRISSILVAGKCM